MAKVSMKELDAVNATITVDIPADDYNTEVTNELKKFRKTASLKGFRQGKAPMTLVRQMVGNQVKMDTVNKLVSDNLYQFLSENGSRFIGQPLPQIGDDYPEVSIENTDDYKFDFSIGMLPEIELKGLDKSEKLTKYEIKIGEELIDEQLETYRERLGSQEPVEDTPKENDILQVLAREMDGKKVKKDGNEASFQVMYNDLGSDELKDAFAKMKSGDKKVVDIFSLDSRLDEKGVKKHLLQFTDQDIEEGTETNADYEVEIKDVLRIKPAEVNEEFFTKLFGEDSEIKDKEAFGNKIKEDYQAYFSGAVNQLLVRQVRDLLVQKNNFELPKDFLLDFLSATNEEKTREQLEKEFPLFAEDFRWSVIRNKVMDKHDAKITREDVRAQVVNEFRQYAQGLPEAQLVQIADNMMNGKEFQADRYESAAADMKFADLLDKEFNFTVKEVEQKEFSEISNAYYDTIEKRQKEILGINEEEE